MQKTQNSSPDEVHIHRNIPQMMFFIIQARISVLVWGRATGKSSGPNADFALNNIWNMPRSNGGILGNSYSDLLTKEMPAIVEGWEQWGIQENIHYFVGKYAPDNYKWKRPYKRPVGNVQKHFFHFWNGSGIHLLSSDHAIPNGLSLDWLEITEARFQKFAKVREAMLVVRGNKQYFPTQSCHGSILITTDMPRHSSEMWILDYEKQMDKESVETIIRIQQKLRALHDELTDLKERDVATVNAEIKKFESYLNELRKQTVYFSTASTLDNVHAIGIDAILNFQKMLSDMDFQISVLNKRIRNIKNGFYPLLSWDDHFMHCDDISYINGLGLHHDLRNAGRAKRTCLWDADIDPHSPLDIACDYNAAINCVSTGQDFPKEYRVLNGQYVLQPLYIKDLAEEWCRYYAPHEHKVVRYIYNQTAIAKSAQGPVSHADEWVRILEKHEWKVERIYKVASTHDARYLLWNTVLSGKDTRMKPIVFNAHNCQQMFISMSEAPAKQVGNQVKKDKKSEQDPNTPPQDATHFSEAVDELIWHAYSKGMREEHTGFAGTITA